MPRGARPLFSVLFFLSGMAGLVYEVCWTRLLRLPMGNTVYSLTAVLTAFMGGLALGSFLAGRWIDQRGRPLRVYALLEAGVGVFCLVLPWIVQAEEPLFRFVYQRFGTSFLAFHLFKFVACGLVILVPATLMGATLPVLCRYFIDDSRRIGVSVGWLYAVNALGAVSGSLLAGFALIPALGQRGAMLVGVATSLTVAAIAWISQSRGANERPAPARRGSLPAAAAREPLSGRLHTAVLIGYGVSGLSAMVFQIAWARVLALVIGSSVYAFALLVSAFILGLAAGSSAVARFADRLGRPALGFAVAEVGIGITALAMIPVFQRFPAWMLRVVPHLSQDFGRLQLLQFGLVFMALLLPTACMGACLPLVGRAVTRGLERAGEAVGNAYSANALGTILGSFLGGFFFLPKLGMDRSIMVGAGLDFLVAVVILALALPLRRAVPLAAGGAVLGVLALAAVPRFDPATITSGAYLYADRLQARVGGRTSLSDLMRDEYAILYYKEGLASTITVKESSGGTRVLAINGKSDASDDKDMQTQVLCGHIAALLHPEPRDAAVIGLASGVTLHSLATHPSVRSIDCMEIVPEMAQACRLFDAVNGRILDDPRVHLLIQDGRNHLTLTDRKYDLIVSEPSNPWMAGIASLYTREFLSACRDRLRPRGLVAVFVHIYSMDLPTFRCLACTFQEVFPGACMWETIFGADYLLVGSRDSLVVQWDDLARRMQQPTVAADLARVDVRTPADLLARHVAAADGVQRLAAGGEIYTDDRNRLEFEAPRLMYKRTEMQTLQVLQDLRNPGPPSWLRLPAGGLPASARQEIEATQAAQADLWRGMTSKSRGRDEEATQLFLAALERDPRLGGASENLLETSREVVSRKLAAGDTTAALQLYERILALAPRVAEFHNERGVILGGMRRLPEAEAEYREAVALKPRNLSMRKNLALALALRREDAAAEVELRRVLEQRPTDVQARLYLANLYVERGDLPAAERECRTAIAVHDESPDGWLLLGEVLYRQASYGPAAEALEAALARGAPALPARSWLADCWRRLGDPGKAARAASRAGAAAP